MALTRGIRRPGQLDATMTRAAQLYARKGLTFTPLRQEVFLAIARSETVMGAYDVLRQMQSHGRKVSPISVYRALTSLLAIGAIRRLKSSSTYFPSYAVLGRGRERNPQTIYVVCEICNCAAEIICPGAYDAMVDAATKPTFDFTVKYVEAAGICARCAAETDKTATSVSRRRETVPHELAFD